MLRGRNSGGKIEMVIWNLFRLFCVPLQDKFCAKLLI
jgi:hypothetical protein